MKIRSHLLAKLIGFLAAQPLRLLAHTLRYSFYFEAPGTNPLDPDCPRSYLMSAWHESILIPILVRRNIRRTTPGNSFAALVSQHQDGTYVVEAMRHFKIDAVRGSTTRGGVLALRKMFAEAPRKHIFITPDGPQGPRRQLKDGILFLASHTGIPILPTCFASRRHWTVKGKWTDTLIPKPFGHVFLIVGAPLAIPPDLSREDFQKYRARLQSEMDRLDAIGQRMVAGEDVRPLGRAA